MDSSSNNKLKKKRQQIAPPCPSRSFKAGTKIFIQANVTVHPSKTLEFDLPLPPLQLPVKIKKKFKGEYIEAIILYSDSVDAYRPNSDQYSNGRQKRLNKNTSRSQSSADAHAKRATLKRKRHAIDTTADTTCVGKSKSARLTDSRITTRDTDKGNREEIHGDNIHLKDISDHKADGENEHSSIDENGGDANKDDDEEEEEEEEAVDRDIQDDGESNTNAGNEDGNNRRASTFVLITKSTKKYKEYEGYICTSLTGALFFCQNNSENGWSYVEESTGVKLHNFRVKNGGLGFMNPKGAHPLYRDYLSLCRLEQAKNNRKFYQPEELVQSMTQTVPIEQVVQYLCRDRPDLLKSLPCCAQ